MSKSAILALSIDLNSKESNLEAMPALLCNRMVFDESDQSPTPPLFHNPWRGASVVVLMSPTPPASRRLRLSTQRAAVWGNQKSSL
ncbi:hypothetical protein B566_EDAN002331 [Ephemera danica]|nr:hypothetical protein B566_EDAN002331 [Ephemera danica]